MIVKILGCAPRVPIVLVGTKLDLRNDPSTLDQLADKNQRPITQSQGEYLARVCSARVYLECSSMLNFNVRNVFQLFIIVISNGLVTVDASYRRSFIRVHGLARCYAVRQARTSRSQKRRATIAIQCK
jgi:hypothetical protein